MGVVLGGTSRMTVPRNSTVLRAAIVVDDHNVMCIFFVISISKICELIHKIRGYNTYQIRVIRIQPAGLGGLTR